MLSVVYAECRCAECRKGALYAECLYAQCLYAECRYADCRYAECRCRIAECRGAFFTPCLDPFQNPISVTTHFYSRDFFPSIFIIVPLCAFCTFSIVHY